MSLEVDLLIETELPSGADPDGLEPLIAFMLKEEEQAADWSIALVLCDDERLRGLHFQFMNDDSVTDIMTFPNEAEEGVTGGDIVISVERAAAQASEWGQTPWQEVRFLVAHGVLHLCGWDDASDGERAAMLDRQRELIEAFDRIGSD